MKISVVIPAFNEEKHIGRTLESLVNQVTTHEYEVIVVENNSTDRTRQAALVYKDQLNLSVIDEKKKGRSPARRCGFAKARGEIIFSTDADTLVPPDWIERIATHFADPKIVAVTGGCIINDCGWLTNMQFNFSHPLLMVGFRVLFGHYWLSGFNFAVRRDIYKRSGGFDPVLNSHEDTDLAKRVNKLGRIKFIRSPKVIFSGRRFKTGFSRGVLEYITSTSRYYLFKDYRKVYLSDVRE